MSNPTYQWSYPYGATDTATVFFKGTPASAKCVWRPPGVSQPVPRQVYTRAVDGSVRVYETGIAGRVITLNFVDLPAGSSASDVALWGGEGVLRFLDGVVGYGMKTFGLWLENGEDEVEVRYLGGYEGWRKGNAGLWTGSIRLAEEV